MVRRGSVGSLIVVCAALIALAVAPSAHAFIYWNDRSAESIGRANLNAGGIDDSFVASAPGACGLTTDSSSIYWGNPNLNVIERATLEGAPLSSLFPGGAQPCGLSQSQGFLAWANLSGDEVGIGNPSTGFFDQNWMGAPGGSPVATAGFFDGVNNLIYFVIQDGSVWFTLSDAQGRRQVLPTGTVDGPAGIAANSSGLYWENANAGTIGQSNLDGSNPHTIVTGFPGSVCGIAVDDNYLYWAELDAGSIGRSNLDGSNPQPYWLTLPSVPTQVLPCWIAVNADTAEASVSPTSLGFGPVVLGSGPSAPQVVTVTNSASTSVDLTPGSVSINGTDAGQFSLGADTCSGATIAPGDSCSVSVTFNPGSLGGETAQLGISSNDPAGPITVPLSGSGVDPDESISPTAIPFGPQLVNTQSQAQTVTVTNGSSATAPDVIGQASFTGTGAGQFQIVSDGCSNSTVAIGDSCQISVGFAPHSPGKAVASLSIPSDDPTSPATVVLTGTGTAPKQAVNPASLSFASQQVGTDSATQSIDVTNSPNASGPLNVASVALAGAGAGSYKLVFDGCSGQSIAPGDDCQVGVRFAPSAAGAQAAMVQISSNWSLSPADVTLNGIGVAVPSSTPVPATAVPGPNCDRLRAKLKKAKSEKKRKAIRKKLKRRGCG